MTDPSRVRMSGALAPLAEGFRSALQAEGYTSHGAVKQLHLFAYLSRWLDAKRLDVADLDREVGRVLQRPSRDRAHEADQRRAADPMLRYLRGLGFMR